MSTNPAVAKGISMDGGTAVAEVLSEQGDTFTFKTRTKKKATKTFPWWATFFVCHVPDRDFSGLHAGGDTLQLAVAGGLCLMWRLAAV